MVDHIPNASEPQKLEGLDSYQRLFFSSIFTGLGCISMYKCLGKVKSLRGWQVWRSLQLSSFFKRPCLHLSVISIQVKILMPKSGHFLTSFFEVRHDYSGCLFLYSYVSSYTEQLRQSSCPGAMDFFSLNLSLVRLSLLCFGNSLNILLINWRKHSII